MISSSEFFSKHIAFVEVFVALYEEGSLSKAQERIGLNVSNISRMIAKLEDTFNEQLFEKTKEGSKPTALGDQFYEFLKKVERLYCDSFSQGLDYEHDNFSISIAANDIARATICPKITAAIYGFAQGASIEFHALPSSRHSSTSIDSFDFLLVGDDFDHPFYTKHLAHEDSLVCIINSNGLDLDKTRYLYGPDSYLNGLLRDHLSLKGLPVQVDCFFTVLEMVSRLNVAAVVPQSLCNDKLRFSAPLEKTLIEGKYSLFLASRKGQVDRFKEDLLKSVLRKTTLNK